MDANDLHDFLRQLNFEVEASNAIRIRMLHNKLNPRGIIVSKCQRRLNTGRRYFYAFLRVNLEQIEHQSRDYKSIGNA